MHNNALIIHPVSTDKKITESLKLSYNSEEIVGLAKAINLDVAYTHTQKLSKVNPANLFGKGVRQTINDLISDNGTDLIIVDAIISPIQQRSLEKEWKCKVIDRIALILEIFGDRAQTKEGKIQVELAALSYQKSRLVKSWTHLERQRGGTGTTGGPGETQIEIDRRLIADKLSKLKKDLKKIHQNRDLQRKNREKVPFPIVAIVGYTNAGKSTLFNKLTDSNIFAEDLLFATLDPTMRTLKLAQNKEVILSDTVGFISNLPTQLIEAFKSTLEQVIYADIILHVRDIADEYSDEQKDDVIAILKEMDIEYRSDPRIIEVWNKIDLLDKNQVFPEHVIPISAITGEGANKLLTTIENKLLETSIEKDYAIPASEGKAINWLHKNAYIIEETYEEDILNIKVKISDENIGRFASQFAI